MFSVYLVDDDTLILEELIDIIPWMDNGFEVIGNQTDPQAAFSEILELKPDVVVCDLKMPRMDGNELMDKLHEAGCKAEFIMLSAYDAYEDVRAFYKGSGFDYILKPVNSDDMQMVLSGVSKKISERNPAPEQQPSATDNESFNQLVKYLDEHFAEKLTLDMLAKKFGFSRNYVCELFARHYNTSLVRYLTDIRMLKAGEMLADRNRQVKDISISCGYPNTAYFYRVFKSYYGMTVKEYRDSKC
ncbi:MAG: response regulator [Butyrivibrio sp.]|nr:response regulator [Butyrivibrio sp.]